MSLCWYLANRAEEGGGGLVLLNPESCYSARAYGLHCGNEALDILQQLATVRQLQHGLQRQVLVALAHRLRLYNESRHAHHLRLWFDSLAVCLTLGPVGGAVARSIAL